MPKLHTNRTYSSTPADPNPGPTRLTSSEAQCLVLATHHSNEPRFESRTGNQIKREYIYEVKRRRNTRVKLPPHNTQVTTFNFPKVYNSWSSSSSVCAPIPDHLRLNFAPKHPNLHHLALLITAQVTLTIIRCLASSITFLPPAILRTDPPLLLPSHSSSHRTDTCGGTTMNTSTSVRAHCNVIM